MNCATAQAAQACSNWPGPESNGQRRCAPQLQPQTISIIQLAQICLADGESFLVFYRLIDLHRTPACTDQSTAGNLEVDSRPDIQSLEFLDSNKAGVRRKMHNAT